MKFQQSVGLCLLALFAFASCKKSDGNKPATKRDTIVYVSGNLTYQDAVLWVDGVLSVLPALNDGIPTTSAITSGGTDIYISGWSLAGWTYLNKGIYTAVYWKNNTISKLGDGLTDTQGNAIAVAGSDVYVAGTMSPNGIVDAAYWKNGIVTNLAGAAGFTSSQALGIAINGPDVYVCGNIVKNGQLPEAVYWKNGVLNEITDGSTHASAVAITVKNNSVYIAYNVYTSNSLQTSTYYWKDGISTLCSNPYISVEIQSLAVDANNVFVAGYAWTSNKRVAALWKNNAIEALSDVTHDARTGSINLCGSDVYVAGSDDGEPVYWKNSTVFKLRNKVYPTYFTPSGITVISR